MEEGLLPDPTADLDWSGFKGAIQDIFSENARRNPQKKCVVETASDPLQARSFTYQQIDQASNLLGHHLVAKGIERGDVVMIYAYRGVDLVVAVMGTLKACATFSVIDPAYPPERQKIYLEVAQPRALIILGKATQEAGELSHTVRSYIDTKLKLKAEVPSLQIDHDGLLDGGEVAGRDLFQAERHIAAINPGILVGPDSNPTLSFTSGSEGKPKGVLGRHFSLAYYFPWMASRFQLSEDDKFTMLSGIAHDPIQRDIFTPLFLGAQILVPEKEDIQHERLAEWMREWGATVTHLTPAMGQILVGGASAKFSALRQAFFVGDILTKRDCNLLRNLAENVNIINMYGTTETQRAVSFFEIPSFARAPTFLEQMKDIMPAGRGMHNVQLLVVDQTDRTKQCHVGQVGEIYVRAAGLAEGYLGDATMNEKKFLSNWFADQRAWIAEDKRRADSTGATEKWRQFYKGPRDRLYRTGDLGQYLPSGDVECTGRADDQVKIRGFRIELGDINSHLSQYPMIRDCVTLVKRNKDEEPILVSYIVPEMNRWPQFLKERQLQDSAPDESIIGMLRRFAPLQDDVRRHLKSKLPVYAVPTLFIPLSKLPLNPNGKVDKPALPFPDIAEMARALSPENEARWKNLTDTERMIASTWAELITGCNARSIRYDDSFFDIGGHSILAQQMLLTVQQQLGGIKVPMAALFGDPTLRGFSKAVDRAKSGSINGHTSTDDTETAYAGDALKLAESLPHLFTSSSHNPAVPKVFLTGASGFLGAYLLRDLLSRKNPSLEVVAHVRARSDDDALQRLENSCKAYGVWSSEWRSRLACVTGSLGEPRMGLSPESWANLAASIDVVIHNGAQVHWVYPYSKLKAPNVQGTIDALRLCAEGRPKRFAFVSSTSVLDSEHYIQLSASSRQNGGSGVLESDELHGSRAGLGTGYGQSKWVCEYLVRECGRRGLYGAIVRPGYILGDSNSGVTNTDDFLVRMLKGCIQLSSRPCIINTVNMVPVNHVARVVVAAAFHPPQSPLGVVQVTSHPRMQFDEYLRCLEYYGYNTPDVPYEVWKTQLEIYVSEGGVQRDQAQHALMPLYHFVTNDLPGNTKASELDDSNAVAVLKADASWSGEDVSAGSAVTRELVGKYLRYLCTTGFLPLPIDSKAISLPEITLTEDQQKAQQHIGGRGSVM